MTERDACTVEANHAGLAQARPVRRVRHCSVHGTAAPRRAKIIPQHAPFDIRGQICRCKPPRISMCASMLTPRHQ